jgi:hypothetical protein
MTPKSSIILSYKADRLICDVVAVEGWEGVEKLYEYLQRNFEATCIARFDGPDARRWIVKVREATLELQYEDPWGNMILSVDAESDAVLRRIAEDLERRFRTFNSPDK